MGDFYERNMRWQRDVNRETKNEALRVKRTEDNECTFQPKLQAKIKISDKKISEDPKIMEHVLRQQKGRKMKQEIETSTNYREYHHEPGAILGPPPHHHGHIPISAVGSGGDTWLREHPASNMLGSTEPPGAHDFGNGGERPGDEAWGSPGATAPDPGAGAPAGHGMPSPSRGGPGSSGELRANGHGRSHSRSRGGGGGGGSSGALLRQLAGYLAGAGHQGGARGGAHGGGAAAAGEEEGDDEEEEETYFAQLQRERRAWRRERARLLSVVELQQRELERRGVWARERAEEIAAAFSGAVGGFEQRLAAVEQEARLLRGGSGAPVAAAAAAPLPDEEGRRRRGTPPPAAGTGAGAASLPTARLEQQVAELSSKIDHLLMAVNTKQKLSLAQTPKKKG